MQTILATGATGLVGSRFVEMYQDAYHVVNMDLTTGVDITRVETFEPFIKKYPEANILIHLAAFTDTTKAQAEAGDEQGLCYKVNVEGTKNIVSMCKKHGIHMIHVSTDFVFDGKNPPAGGYTEDDPTAPLDWYGATKARAEAVVQESGTKYTIARISYPYRAHFDLKPDLIRKIRTGLESGTLPPQFTDSKLTPTFVDNIAEAFHKMIEKKPEGIFHVTGSTSLSPFALAQKVALAYGFDPQLVKVGSLTEYLEKNPRPFARELRINNHKATETLGLHFATIDEGLAELKKQQA